MAVYGSFEEVIDHLLLVAEHAEELANQTSSYEVRRSRRRVAQGMLDLAAETDELVRNDQDITARFLLERNGIVVLRQ